MNVYLNELIAFALVIPLSLVFAMFAAAMPRSGGDYVYVSRTLHPALGMMSSWNNTVWWFIYGGVPSAFFARYGLGPFLRTVGDMSGSSTLTDWGNTLVGNRGTVIAGTILIVVLCAIFSRSLRLYFRLQNTLFLFAMASIVLSIVVFAGQEPRRRRRGDRLDLRHRQREGRAQGWLSAGLARPAKHHPADDLALPGARVQPVVRVHRR